MHGIGEIHGLIGAQPVQQPLIHGNEFGLLIRTCDARKPFRLSILVAQSGKELDAARVGAVHVILLQNMRRDLDRRSTEAFVQPGAKLRLMSRRHAGLTTLPAVGRKRVPATFSVGLVPSSNGIIVQVEKLRDGLTGLPIIKEQDGIGPPCNAVVFAMAALARGKLTQL